MPVKNQSLVSIQRCTDHGDPDAVKEAVRQLLDPIGGLETLINPGDRVLLKPNLILGSPYTTGVTTNPHVVFALADLSREAGATDIVIAEGSAVGVNTTNVLQELGYVEMAEKHNCRIVDLHKDTFTRIVNPAGRNIRRLRLPDTWLETDVVINVPCMKTHDILGVTLGLKNMKGLLHPADKKRFHKWGLEQCVVEMSHLTIPELTVMDATIGLEGDGPVVGNPVNMGLLLASKDTVALDRICMDIMGFESEDAPYVAMAAEAGLGCDDRAEIVVTGGDPNKLRHPFRRGTLDREKLSELDIRVLACDACSGCQHAITGYLNGQVRADTIGELHDTTFVYGQNPKLPEDASGRIVRFGSCTRSMTERGIYIPGCPPHPSMIKDKIEEMKKADAE